MHRHLDSLSLRDKHQVAAHSTDVNKIVPEPQEPGHRVGTGRTESIDGSMLRITGRKRRGQNAAIATDATSIVDLRR